jgi:hypothetical protein
MIRPWTRDCTKEWFIQLENRIEDFDYYLYQAEQWCNEHDVYNESIIFACKILTMTWVSHMRDEILSKREVFEIIGVVDWYNVDDDIYELGPNFQGLELEEILEEVVNHPW